MKLGKASRYAIEGLVVLAKHRPGTTMQLREIAVTAKVPENFLAKIFQKLNRTNIVVSSRGARRGYALARRSNIIKVDEILLAIEGSDLFDRCVFWSDRCADRSPCPMHFQWKQVRQGIANSLKKTTLADLAGVKSNP